MKKELQRKLSFVLFVMAVFFAGLALMVFPSSVLLICLAGVYLLAATVFFVWMKEEKSQSPTEKTSELLLADRMAELMRGNEKAEKGVYIAIKKQHETMEKGLERLEAKLSELLTAQENAVKTIVLYNKENAKQVALSEKEELGRLRGELIQSLQSEDGTQLSMSPVVDAVKEMSHRIYEEFHENGEAMLSELETTADCLDEIREIVRKLSETGINYVATAPVAVAVPTPVASVPEPVAVPEPVVTADPTQPLSQDDIAALFAGMDVSVPEAVAEPEPVAVPEPVVTADPTQPLSQDDIAALFAGMDVSVPEAVAEPEPVTEKNPEDALASSGVDLSDPNKQLSADDIAALFAAMGN